ncbi:hypothetical protein H2198_008744 [Neophaeococcomyces mojaviensis]|uniref:Uncharacterized protein n=1 Tax=Neophaeococcomyces mojaviensis TaxID=3383035 RepID=A0ACC2ZWB1_9EURO|nr:hypothetical protein H2198_008744 [Knufia sp. JES_112]
MARRVPAGFKSIAEAAQSRDQLSYNVIGVCTDYLPPAMSRGTDFTMKMSLWDTSCAGAQDVGEDGMLIRMFYKRQSMFPPIENTGDIVILRNLKTKNQGSQWFGVSNFETSWVVISATSLMDSTCDNFSDVVFRQQESEHAAQKTGRAPDPTLAELKYAKALLEAKDPSTLRGPPKSTALDVYTIMKDNGGQPTPPKQQKYRMLKDLVSPAEYNGLQFADLLGEICKVYDNGGNVVEVKLTDYTEHPLLFDYATGGREGDDFAYIQQKNGWTGPVGRMTITVNVWGEHGNYIRKLARDGDIKLGMYMRVRNVQIKMDRNGSVLEGHLRDGGSSFGSSVSLHRPREAEHDKNLKELLQRKRAYDLETRAKGLGLQQTDVPSKKRAAEDELVRGTEQVKKQSKSARKREKNKKLHEETQARAPGSASLAQLASNQHVRCEGIEVPLTSLSTIIEGQFLQRETPSKNPYRLPFQNCKYKTKVKVVDFFPDRIEDFAIPYRVSDYEALSDHESGDEEGATLPYARQNPDHVRWDWHFFLMVEDPERSKNQDGTRDPIVLQVAGTDGDYLLNAEACDLRKEPTELAKLKQKLFVLWGDLEEKKLEHDATGTQLKQHGHAVSSRPFECFIKEFGIQARDENGRKVEDEYERIFSIFGTRIC